tara:strand:+ start:9431 stop:10468 length:1038 start_codon:yes stop_codon:yes gene_type:complete
MNQFITILILSAIFYTDSAMAESIWVKYGNQIYKGTGDAKSVALSFSEVSSAVGPFASLVNPARLTEDTDYTLNYTHQERFSGIVNFDLAGWHIKNNQQSKWSLVLIHEGVQHIPNTTQALMDANGNGVIDENERLDIDKIKFFNQSQWAAILGIGTSKGSWKLGGNIKGLYHSLDAHAGFGLGFDFGVSRNFGKNHSIGFMIKDITTSWIVWDSGTVERILPEISAGDLYTLNIAPLRLKINLTTMFELSLEGRNQSEDFHLFDYSGMFRSGIDLQYNEKFHIRFGRNPLTKYSAGLGFEFPAVEINYAFTPSPMGSLLGTSHYISAALNLQSLERLKETLGEL